MIRCNHDNTRPKADHVVCTDCGGVYPDSGWGIARGQWFPSLDVARFYKANGYLPQPAQPMSRDSVAVHVVEELLTNIKRTCIRGRNVADMKAERNFVATCDHIENLADQAIAALTREAAPQASEVEALAQSVERIASCRDGAGYNSDADCLRTAASMIRRLATTDSAIQSQQGATGGAVGVIAMAAAMFCDNEWHKGRHPTAHQIREHLRALHPQAAGSAPDVHSKPAIPMHVRPDVSKESEDAIVEHLRTVREDHAADLIEQLQARNAELEREVEVDERNAAIARDIIAEADKRLTALLDGIEGLESEMRDEFALTRVVVFIGAKLKALREKANGSQAAYQGERGDA
jgi:hypothetical protein